MDEKIAGKKRLLQKNLAVPAPAETSIRGQIHFQVFLAQGGLHQSFAAALGYTT
jgi:hypothetical protein